MSVVSPNIIIEDVYSILADYYDIPRDSIIAVKALGSCQDANFKVDIRRSTLLSHETITTDNSINNYSNYLRSNQIESFVLKIYNSSLKKEYVIFENDVLAYLYVYYNNSSKQTTSIQIPKVKPTKDTSYVAKYESLESTSNFVRLLSYIQGSTLSSFKYFSPDVCFDYGRFVADIDTALSTYNCSFSSTESKYWDMRNAVNMIQSFVKKYPFLLDDENNFEIHNTTLRMNELIHSKTSNFKCQLIHGDLAYYNVITTLNPSSQPHIHGVIDFGDITYSWLIGELVTAITPCLVQTHKPSYLIASDIVRGFVHKISLNRDEAFSLWPLIIIRSALLYFGICNQCEEDPGNQYCQDELVLNRQILKNILTIPIELAQENILLVCGFDSSFNIDEGTIAASTTSLLSNIFSLHLQYIDLSVKSDLYCDGNWARGYNLSPVVDIVSEHRCQDNAVYDFLNKSHFSQNMKKNALYILNYGRPILLRTTTNSLTPPSTIPLHSSMFYNSQNSLEFISPYSCKIKIFIDSSSSQEYTDLILLRDGDATAIKLSGDIELCDRISDGDHLEQGQLFARSASSNKRRSLSHFIVQCCSVPCGNDVKFYIERYLPMYCSEEEKNVWTRICPNPTRLLGLSFYADGHVDDNLSQRQQKELTLRYQYFGAIQEHYYRVPPVIERGHGQYLYDKHSRCYLDMVNNVAVVGHSHRAITNEATKQLSLLNTNSRFIYESLGKFSERIISTIPKQLTQSGKLNCVLLVNSGSEATDLALRIARSVVTSRRKQSMKHDTSLAEDSGLMRDVMCLQGAYHGVTASSDEVSTTLNDNPRSLETRPPWIHLVPMPNLYRGEHRLNTNHLTFHADSNTKKFMEDLAEKYADFVKSKVRDLVSQNKPPVAFISEPLVGNAGGVILPPGYLKRVYDHIRAVGGLCICDEVQVGYGRLGYSFWGFEEHDIVPDIVTMAKAAGNGFPLGYVVTSKDIVEEFRALEGSFFSSAGGSPLSCCIGYTVLDIIEREKLQENALIVGKYMNDQLKELASKFPKIVGCIHGYGLYQGIELIKAQDGSTVPAAEAAYAICERLLELGVITHNTGDYSNVLKVKPPLCCTKDDVDFFINALSVVFQNGW